MMKAVLIGLETLISLSLVSAGFTLLMTKVLFTQQTVSQSYATGALLLKREGAVQQAVYTIRSSNLTYYQASGVLGASFGNGYSLQEITLPLQNNTACECVERLLAIDNGIYLLKVWGNESAN